MELGNSEGRTERLRRRELEGESGSTVAWMPREKEVGISITEPSKDKDHWF